MHQFRDPVTRNLISETEHTERERQWSKQWKGFVGELVGLNPAEVCRRVYEWLDAQGQGEGGRPPAAPLCRHAPESYLPDHLLLTSAIAYCLGYGHADVDLNLLRLAAMSHDFPDDARRKLAAGLSEAEQELLQSAWTALDDQKGWLERIVQEGGFPAAQEAKPPEDAFIALLWQAHLAASASLGDKKVTDEWQERWVPSSKEGFARHPLAAVEGKVGLVYGGATKIKGYVFESAKLPEVRGASVLLDRINLYDARALFGERNGRYGLVQTFMDAPECVIYANGGDILALAPTSLAKDIASEIERLYITETLVGQGVAIAREFSLLELQYGLRPDEFWIQEYQDGLADKELGPVLRAYYGVPNLERGENDETLFFRRKTFNELSTSLALERHRRRDGNPPRLIPNFEIISYARRCSACDRRGAVHYFEAQDYYLCEPCAHKRYVGYLAKKFGPDTRWFTDNFLWPNPEPIWLWYREFEEKYLARHPDQRERYYGQTDPRKADNPWDLGEIAQVSDPPRFIGLIYADGNNVGGLVERIASPAAYRQFARRLFLATRDAVFASLADHLQAAPITASEERTKWTGETGDVWIHPFEILSIGGDDLLLIVPGSKALEIANDIARRLEQPFQSQWLFKSEVKDVQKLKDVQRYWPVDEEGRSTAEEPKTLPVVSLSAGVVIAAENTPVFFLLDLASELLKSAKCSLA